MSKMDDEVERDMAHVGRVLSLLTKDRELSLEYMHLVMLMLLKHWAATARLSGTCSACALTMAEVMVSQTRGPWLPHAITCLKVEASHDGGSRAGTAEGTE